jgi:hypothetical protein
MSSERTVGIVCEGPTDYHVLVQMMAAVCSDELRPLALWPERDSATGRPLHDHAGWTSVKIWCEQNGQRLRELVHDFGPKLDALVVSVDADIAEHVGVPVALASDLDPARLVQRLGNVLRRWLRGRANASLPPEVVFAIPVRSLEAWIVKALYPRRRNVERHPRPIDVLVDDGYFVVRSNGTPKKDEGVYINLSRTVADKLPSVERLYSAKEFLDRVRLLLSQ